MATAARPAAIEMTKHLMHEEALLHSVLEQCAKLVVELSVLQPLLTTARTVEVDLSAVVVCPG